MNKKWKIITILGITTLTCSLYQWGIPAIANISSHKNFIEKSIYSNSGYKIDIGNPKLSMGTFPSIWIKSDNITLLNDDNSKALSIDNPKLKIKLLPLLKKKIEISKLSATKEEANFVLNKNSQFMLGQYLLKQNDKNPEYTLFKMEVDLGEYHIKLDDNKNNQKLNLDGKYFNHGKYIQNKHVKFATENTLTVGNKSSNVFADIEIDLPINKISEDKFKIDMQVSDFDLGTISEYVKILSNGKITSLGGIINISTKTQSDKMGHKKIIANLKSNNLKITGQDSVSKIIHKDNLNLFAKFRTIENGIFFEKIKLEGRNIHAFADGKIFNLGHKQPKYNLNAEVKNTRIEDVINILTWSDKFPPDFNFYKLKQYVFYGNGEGKLNFEGQGNRPNVNGYVKLWDAYLIHPMKGAPANAKIDLKFEGQRMLLDVFVPAANNQSVEVKGNVKIDGSKYSELNIKSTDNVPLAPAQEILNPLHEILKFQLGPVPIMKISGFGGIKLRSAGKKIDPHIWGNIHFNNATASFNEIPKLVLHNGFGEVKFDDTQVTFKTTKAFIEGRPVEIKGDCSVLGKLNVYVNSKGHDIKKLIKIINSAPILVDVQKVIKPFKNPEGIADVYLNIYGTAKNAEEVVFNQDLFSKGTITFHNAKTTMQDTFLPITNINGVVNFDKYDSDYDVTGFVRNSKLRVVGTGSNSEIDLKAYSDKFKLNDVFDILHQDMPLPYKNDIGQIYASFTAGYKGIADADNMDYSKVKVDGKFLSNIETSNPIRVNGGTFNIANNILKTSTLKGLFNNNPFTLSFTAKDIDKEDFNIADANFNFKNFDLSAINSIKNQIKLPKEFQSQIENISNIVGIVDINGTIKNNRISADTNLKSTSFVYKPLDAVVRIINGNAKMRGETLYLDKINTRVSSMPVFLNGKISNIYSAIPSLDLFVSSKLTQNFFDRFYNSKSVYPVKTKGEINFYTNLKGAINALEAKSTLNLAENSSIYYMGATIAGAPTGAYNADGMTTNPVSIVSDAILYPNKLKLNSFKYNQTITSQSKKKSTQTQVDASGEISLLKDNVLGFKNLKIKTDNPTNARIFNVLFKKPTIKQGVFTSDLTINGTSLVPQILGTLNVKGVDIPVLDSTVRDINVEFAKDLINLETKAVVLTNDILMKAKIKNDLNPPIVVENLDVNMDELNLNVIANAMSEMEADNTRNYIKTNNSNDLPDLPIVKDANINASNILIKKAQATDFKSHFTIDKDGNLKVDNYGFKLANGNVSGDITYDLQNLNGKANMSINNADAQIIAENFFDMQGQIFGIVTGNLTAQCSGLSGVDCINTLSGDGSFEVVDGKMPKLGSLEYLLKAGNLLTGGVTGLSINGIIDLITPLKTGNFKKISGDVHVKDGVADSINVYSSGEDLNMYLTGSYNIASLVADMEVYGSLSKNFSTILGKIGNSSLNTLFNTIPGININEINPKSTSNIHKIPNFDKANTLRVFKSEIYGDINGSNYVKSFRWIKD
jgi:hypothetical protein